MTECVTDISVETYTHTYKLVVIPRMDVDRAGLMHLVGPFVGTNVVSDGILNFFQAEVYGISFACRLS